MRESLTEVCYRCYGHEEPPWFDTLGLLETRYKSSNKKESKNSTYYGLKEPEESERTRIWSSRICIDSGSHHYTYDTAQCAHYGEQQEHAWVNLENIFKRIGGQPILVRFVTRSLHRLHIAAEFSSCLPSANEGKILSVGWRTL